MNVELALEELVDASAAAAGLPNLADSEPFVSPPPAPPRPCPSPVIVMVSAIVSLSSRQFRVSAARPRSLPLMRG